MTTETVTELLDLDDIAELAAQLRVDSIRCSTSAGPGSTSHAGPESTIHVLVPLSVNGPGLAARIPTIPCSESSVRVTA